MKIQLWVVGKFNASIQTVSESYVAWELQGIFENIYDAEDACISEQYFIGPINLNELLPYEKIEWPGVYYPHDSNRTTK